MADTLSSLLSGADLTGFQSSVAQRDPYGIIGSGLAAFQPNYQYMNAGESLLTSFTKSFASGLLQTYVQDRAADQLKSVVDVLPQLTSDPLKTAIPEGVDSSPFNILRGTAALNKASRDEQVKAQSADLQRELRKVLGIEGLKSGALDMPGTVSYVDTGKLPEGNSIDPSKNPKSSQYQLNKDLLAEEDAARKEIAALPAVATFNQISTALPRLDQLSKINSKTSDIPFTYAFVQGMDGGVVKEGEKLMIQGGNPLLQAYKNAFESALNGESELGVDLKQKMVQELKGSQSALHAEALRQAKTRLDIATGRGASSKSVLPFDADLKFEEKKLPPITTEKYNELRLQGLTKEQIKAQYGG